jgi:proline iminopeptidase
MIGSRITLALAAAAGVYVLVVRPRLRHYGASHEEAGTIYPGDELIPDADAQTTMAVTLPAPPEAVWPWLVQMGCDRAGWYSWDRLDNGGRPSAERVVPEWQDRTEGDRMISTPGGATWFTVARMTPPRDLVLRAALELPSGRPLEVRGPLPRVYNDGIWAFHLRPLPGGRTRLVVRTRSRGRPRWADRAVGLLFGEPAHFIMQRRQFRNLHRRVASAPAAGPRVVSMH